MAQQHLDRLTPVDAGFLHQEGHSTHMHIGGVMVFDGPSPGHAELQQHIAQRLPLVPRYRQKLAWPPAGLGRQRWIDDATFNLDYHVRHTALPSPGDDDALLRLSARIFGQALDRTKPLWELWLVEGLSDGRFALISKTHHALVDGISGVDLMTMLFDVTKVPRDVGRVDRWVPRPAPSAAELAAAGLRDLATLPLRAAGLATHPGRALDETGQALGAVTDVARQMLFEPAPGSPLNVPITPHRRLAFVTARLEEFKTVKRVFGGTVNDVVLTAVAGALRRFYEFRGEPVDGVTLRVSVPVSTRSSDQRGALGNRITQMIAPLPLHIDDPIARLAEIRRAMDGVKESKQAVDAETIIAMEDFAPPTILAQASRLNFHNRFFNLLVTNVPGPQMPIYLLGRELRAIYPIPFLAGDRALAIAIMSYNGGVHFGLLGDYDTLPDIDLVADGLEQALAELVALADERTKQARPSKRRASRRTSAATRANGTGGRRSTRGTAGANGRRSSSGGGRKS